jgi:glycosyltransferase involved in cell wall biosynthesis
MPRASILIPVYNSAPTLARCLRSAMQQTLSDIEILVADDASTDDSAAIAESIAATDPRITVLRLPQNGGKPKAMNIMVQRATGDFLAVLDADDAFHDSRLQTLIGEAENAGADMAADNLLYVDAGMPAQTGPCAGFGAVIRAAFDAKTPPRIVTKSDLIAKTSAFAEFDYGILKPVMRASFLREHALTYDETSRLAEDFTYLMRFLIAGGRALLWPAPLYYWTMPFGTQSRAWTQTGAGAWRYDYRQALRANADLIAEMRARGENDIVTMLQRRGRQYRAMIPYIDAQRQAAGGHRLLAALTIARHPATYGLLALRIAGRIRRAITPPTIQPA